VGGTITVTLFFPLFWAYNNEVVCSVQPGTPRISLYRQTQKRFSWVGILLRNI
jgi:hypothetical protein